MHIDNYSRDNVKDIEDYVCLYCVQNKEKIKTNFLPAKLIFDSLDEVHIKQLTNKNFHFVRTDSFGIKEYGDSFPIFRINEDSSVGIHYGDFGNIAGSTYKASEALLHLKEKIAELEKQTIDIPLESGDLLVFRNNPSRGNVLHGRELTPDSYKRKDRPDRRLLARTIANEPESARGH